MRDSGEWYLGGMALQRDSGKEISRSRMFAEAPLPVVSATPGVYNSNGHRRAPAFLWDDRHCDDPDNDLDD